MDDSSSKRFQEFLERFENVFSLQKGARMFQDRFFRKPAGRSTPSQPVAIWVRTSMMTWQKVDLVPIVPTDMPTQLKRGFGSAHPASSVCVRRNVRQTQLHLPSSFRIPFRENGHPPQFLHLSQNQHQKSQTSQIQKSKVNTCHKRRVRMHISLPEKAPRQPPAVSAVLVYPGGKIGQVAHV